VVCTVLCQLVDEATKADPCRKGLAAKHLLIYVCGQLVGCRPFWYCAHKGARRWVGATSHNASAASILASCTGHMLFYKSTHNVQM
jgi:hypothetical protein